MKAIPGEYQHTLVVADIHNKEIRNVVTKMCTDRENIGLLKDVKIMEKFKEKYLNWLTLERQICEDISMLGL